MTGLTVKRHIQAPPEKVFEHATDLRKAPERVRGIIKLEVLTEGPIGVGTRFRETRIMFKREATEEMEITTFDPPRGYSLRADSHGCNYRTEFRMTPANGGTELEMAFEATPVSFMAKLMTVMMKPMMKAVRKECEKDLDDIKAAVEKDVGVAPAPAD